MMKTSLPKSASSGTSSRRTAQLKGLDCCHPSNEPPRRRCRDVSWGFRWMHIKHLRLEAEVMDYFLIAVKATSLFCESIRVRSHTTGFATPPTDVRGPRSASRPTITSCGSPAGSTPQLRCITSQVFSPRLRSWRGSRAPFVVLQFGLTDTTFLLKAP
ncbi:uncharacterized protein ACBT57_004755 [Dama dama]